MTEIVRSPDMFRERLHQLYTQHHDHVLRACNRYVQNRADADDLTVEVLLKAARGWTEFASDEDLKHPRTWLYRVAFNHCMDHLRRRIRNRDRLLRYADSVREDAAAEKEEREDREEKEERKASGRSGIPSDGDRPHASFLNRLVEHLDPMDRQVLHLLLEEGVNQKGAARLTGVSRSSIARRLMRIRQRAWVLRLGIGEEDKGRSPSAPLSPLSFSRD